MDNTSPRHPDPQQVDEAIAATGGDREQRWLTTGVAGVGAASFCSDARHEIATSVLPGFLTVTLHAAPSALGVVEGISDALVGVSKLAGGPLAADPARRGRLASSGYLGTALATSAIGLATSVWQVGVLRALAWAGRASLLPVLLRLGHLGTPLGILFAPISGWRMRGRLATKQAHGSVDSSRADSHSADTGRSTFAAGAAGRAGEGRLQCR